MNNLNNPYVASLFALDWIRLKRDWCLRLDIPGSPVSWFLVGCQGLGAGWRDRKREAKIFLPLSLDSGVPWSPSNISSMVHILPGRPTWSDSPVLEMLPPSSVFWPRGWDSLLSKGLRGHTMPSVPPPHPVWLLSSAILVYQSLTTLTSPSSFSVLIRLQPPQLEMEHHLAKLPTSSFAHSLSLAFPSWSYLNFLPQRGLKLGPVG